jgi:prepilin-type N-terminal cleavage/methylation domain-containing protein
VTGIHGAGPLPRRGMTLVEMLVATTITLIMMGLVAQLFGVFGQGVTGSRSVIELTDQMRSVGWRLRQDLGGVTATTLPPLRPEANEGYFELFEGPATDTSTATLVPTSDKTALTADCDDALLFTTRSQGPPFVGRFIKGTIESPVAEVAWYCRPAAQQLASGPTLYTLYRRQLLVMDYVGANPPANAPFFFSATGGNVVDFQRVGNRWDTFYNGDGSTFFGFDLSCRLVPSANNVRLLVPNSLGDLTKRENRFGHYPTDVVATPTFPYSFVSIAPLSGLRTGEDVILNNVLGFDVRVFDPDAPVQTPASGGGVTPGDPGFAINGDTKATGAYVDLCWGRNVAAPVASAAPGAAFPTMGAFSAFQTSGVMVSSAIKNAIMSGTLALPEAPVAGGPGATNVAVYDTWSTHYETNGINENGNTDPNNNPLIDEGTNGLDDNSNGLVDEPAEAETSAPYPVPLRGIEVRIRCYEPSSRQVRQVTIRHTFVPF